MGITPEVHAGHDPGTPRGACLPAALLGDDPALERRLSARPCDAYAQGTLWKGHYWETRFGFP